MKNLIDWNIQLPPNLRSMEVINSLRRSNRLPFNDITNYQCITAMLIPEYAQIWYILGIFVFLDVLTFQNTDAIYAF